MKLLTISFLLFFSLSASAQYPDSAEMEKILNEVIAPLKAGEKDAFLERLTYPFRVKDETYSKSQLKAVFDKVFVSGTVSCLNDEGSYQVAMSDDHTRYLAVCFSAPEGYEVSVFVFELINDKWMIAEIDLQND